MSRLRALAGSGEVAIVALLFAVAAWWGGHYVGAFMKGGGEPSFYQHYFEPAVMLACGRGFNVSPPPRPKLVDDFLYRRTDSLDCGQLPADMVVGPRNVYQYGWFYLMLLVSLTWTLLGVSWSGMTPLFGLLFGLVIVLAYGIFRVGVPRLPAAAAALMLVVSPLHLQNLPHLRDYAKAPFVLALILILLALVRRPLPPRRILTLAALYGVVLGFGYGFRTDLLANIPPFLLVMAVFLPGGLTRHLWPRVAAVVVMFAIFVTISWPAAAYVVTSGGCQWHAVLLGMSDLFSRDLGVSSSFYDWVPVFSDEYLHTAVNSYEYRLHGSPVLAYCSAAYDAASGTQMVDIVAQFPADALTRAYGSILRVLDLPFYLWRAGWDASRGSSAGAVLHELSGSGRLAVLAALFIVGAQDLRLGLLALCAVLYFGSYPSMQFADRHFFHLEFIGWWGMSFVGWWIAGRWLTGTGQGMPTTRHHWRQFGAAGLRFAAIAAVVILIPLWGLRFYQQGLATNLTRELLAAPRTEVAMVATTGGRGLDVAPGALPELDADQRQAAYLDVHVDLAACPGGVTLVPRYDSSRGPFDFTGPLMTRPTGTVAGRVLFPVYRYFRGVELESGTATCITRVERLQSIEGRRLLPVLTLAPDWATLPAHQRLRAPDWWRTLLHKD